MLKQQIEIGTFDLKVAEHNETVRKNQAAEQLAARKAAGGGGGGSAAKVKYDPTALAARFGLDPAKVAGMPPMTIGEFSGVLEAARKGQVLSEPTERENQARDLAIFDPSATGVPNEEGVIDRQLRQANGDPWYPSKVDADKLKPQIAAMTTLASLANEQMEFIRANGGESGALKGDDYQKAVSNQAAMANLLRESYAMGTLDNAALELATKIQGADPTSYLYDGRAGLNQMLSQAERKMDASMKAAGWNPKAGVSYKLPRLAKAPTAKADKDYDALISASESAPNVAGVSVASLKGDKKAARAAEAATGRAVSAEQEKGLDALAKRAETDPAAMQKLVAASMNADNPAAKKAALGRVIRLAAAGHDVTVGRDDEGDDAE
jgi:hypothetical protein